MNHKGKKVSLTVPQLRRLFVKGAKYGAMVSGSTLTDDGFASSLETADKVLAALFVGELQAAGLVETDVSASAKVKALLQGSRVVSYLCDRSPDGRYL